MGGSCWETHWVETSRIFYITPTLRLLKMSHSTLDVSSFQERTILISCTPAKKKLFFPYCWLLCLLQKPQRTGRSEITGSGPGLGKIPDDQIWMFKCVLLQHKLLLKCLFDGYFKWIYVFQSSVSQFIFSSFFSLFLCFFLIHYYSSLKRRAQCNDNFWIKHYKTLQTHQAKSIFCVYVSHY